MDDDTYGPRKRTRTGCAMDGMRQNVLGWKTLADGRLGIVVEGPNGRPKGGPILNDAHDMKGLQFDGKRMRPAFRNSLRDVIRPGSTLDDIGFSNLDLSSVDMRGTHTTGVSFFACDMRNMRASRLDGKPSNWDSVSISGCDLSGADLDDLRSTHIRGRGAFSMSTIQNSRLDHASMRGVRIQGMRIDRCESDHLRLSQARFEESKVRLNGSYMDMRDMAITDRSRVHLDGDSRATAMLQGATAAGGAKVTAARTTAKPVPANSEESTFAMLDDVSVTYDPQLRAHYRIRVPIGDRQIEAQSLTIQAPEQDVWQQGIGEHVPCGLVNTNRIYEAQIDHAKLGNVSVPVRADMLEGIRTGQQSEYLADQIDMVRKQRMARSVMASLRESGFVEPEQKPAPTFEARPATQRQPERAYATR